MCIIVYKPKGINLPKDSVLETCFNNNPDGAGYCYNNVKGVTINKGFLYLKDFKKAITELNKTIDPKDHDMLFHFRLATQGFIDEANCHPFPISFYEDELTALNMTTKFAIVHNGIIDFCNNYFNKEDDQYSDTILFIRDYLAHIPAEQLFSDAIQDLIFYATKSKFALMNRAEVNLIGKFILEKDNCYYSNNSYRTYKIKKIKTENYLIDYPEYFGNIQNTKNK